MLRTIGSPAPRHEAKANDSEPHWRGTQNSLALWCFFFSPTQYGQGMPRDEATWCYCLCNRMISVTINSIFLWACLCSLIQWDELLWLCRPKHSWNQARFCLLCYIPFSKTHLQRWEYSCHSDRQVVGYTLGQSFLGGLAVPTAFQNVYTV